MKSTDSPKKHGIIFAQNGQKNAIPNTGTAGSNAASYTDGFPPITMLKKSQGGLPPDGKDMNGILNELSALSRWYSAGSFNKFDATFATEIGGYPKGALIIGNDNETLWLCTQDDNINNPNAVTTGWVKYADYVNKVTSVNGRTGAVTGLLNVGDYGVGSNTVRISDYNTISESGLFNSDTSTANRPPYDQYFFAINLVDSLGNKHQKAFSYINTISAERYFNATTSTYSAWNLFDSASIPVGIPLPWAQTTPPSGWLKCDGSPFNTINYPLLTQAYPSGVLPDLRGEFIRGWDDGRGVDAGRNILSQQKGSIVGYSTSLSTNNVGAVGIGTNPHQSSLNNSCAAVGCDLYDVNEYQGLQIGTTSPNSSSSLPGSETTMFSGIIRPRNVAFLYIVRAL